MNMLKLPIRYTFFHVFNEYKNIPAPLFWMSLIRRPGLRSRWPLVLIRVYWRQRRFVRSIGIFSLARLACSNLSSIFYYHCQWSGRELRRCRVSPERVRCCGRSNTRLGSADIRRKPVPPSSMTCKQTPGGGRVYRSPNPSPRVAANGVMRKKSPEMVVRESRKGNVIALRQES